jgi:hypothetical protein
MMSLGKKKKYGLVILPVLLLAVLALLPFILSSPAATRIIVSGISKRVPGNLTVDSWLVGWQQGFLCQDIRYEDPQRGVRLAIPRLTSTQGLVELILAPRNLGLVTVDSPVLEMTVSPPARDGREERPVPRRAGGSGGNWDRFSMQLHVRDGLLRVAAERDETGIGIKDLALDSSLAAGEVKYDLNFRAEGGGDFSASGRLNLPANRGDFFATFSSEAEIRIHDLQLRDYLDIAGRYFRLPGGEGRLTADLRLKTAGREDFGLSGFAEFSELRLAGGILGKDEPYLQKVRLTAEDLEWSALYRRVRELRIESDAGVVACSGEYKDRRLQIQGTGDLSIPVLFDRFPHLLRVREEVFVESGSLAFNAGMVLQGMSGRFDFMARTENLGGLFDGRPFAWDTPVTAILHGENEGFDVNIERLQIQSPFLEAYGKGDLTSFDLDATADLGRSLAELGRLFQHPWRGSGELELSMQAASAGTGGRYAIDTDLNISRFSLSRHDTVVVPNQYFSMVGGAIVPLSLLREGKGSFELQFALSTWLGEIFLAMNGEKVHAGFADTRFSTDTSLQLASLSRLLQALDFVPEETEVGGDLQVQAAGYIDGTLAGLDEFNGRIRDFAFLRKGSGFRDPLLELHIRRAVNDEIPSLVVHDLEVVNSRENFFSTGAGSNSIDFRKGELYLHDIGVRAGPGELELDELALRYLERPLIPQQAEGVFRADLAKFTPLLHNFSLIPGDIGLAGAGDLTFSAAGSNVPVSAGLRISGFSVHREKSTVLPAGPVEMSLELERGADPGRLVIRGLRLSSVPLHLEAGGSFDGTGGGRVMELRGKAAPDLHAFADIIANATGREIVMRGAKESEFTLRCSLPPGSGTRDGPDFFAASLFAEDIKYKGLHGSGLTIPISLEEGLLQVQVQGGMNQGAVNLAAAADFNREPAVVSVPGERRVLSDIEIGKPLVEGLLQAVHPLFGVLATPEGRLSVRLDTFSWPLVQNGGQAAEYRALLDISRINLDSSGFLRSILGAFALDKEKLRLRDTEVTCSGSGGRISCSPVRILAADAEMTLSGSVGLDKTLDYVLEVPITDKLVSREVHQFLEGAAVRVPIGGTVENPSFDRKTLTAAIRDLVREAAARVVERQAQKLLPDLLDHVPAGPGK